MDPNPSRRRITLSLVALAGMAAAPESEPTAPVPSTAWSQAHVQGKYRILLRQFKDAEARSEYSDSKDVGFREATEWKGQRDLPPGHWVYVYPYWYIWRETTASAPTPKPPYCPDQATGPPDTPGPGDQASAWASATPDQQDEWLELQFARAVVPSALKIYENCSPGALTKVSLFKLDGTEETAWSGRDPTPSYRPMGVSVIPIVADQPIARIKIQLESTAVPGWNEIDAVGLVDSEGKTQWAVAVLASTVYGQPNPQNGLGMIMPPPPPPATTAPAPAPAPVAEKIATRTDQTLAGLASELRQSRTDYAELKQLLQKSQDEIKALKDELEALKRRVPATMP